MDELSEVEEEQEFPTLGSGSESSTYDLSKKKRRRPKEKKEKREKKPRKKREDEDEDQDQDEDGTMRVSLAWAQSPLNSTPTSSVLKGPESAGLLDQNLVRGCPLDSPMFGSERKHSL